LGEDFWGGEGKPGLGKVGGGGGGGNVDDESERTTYVCPATDVIEYTNAVRRARSGLYLHRDGVLTGHRPVDRHEHNQLGEDARHNREDLGAKCVAAVALPGAHAVCIISSATKLRLQAEYVVAGLRA